MCTVSKPIVDGLEAELQGRVEVLHVDLLGEVGRDAARRYNVRLVPTLLLFDGAGNVIARHEGILLNAGAIRSAALALLEH